MQRSERLELSDVGEEGLEDLDIVKGALGFATWIRAISHAEV